MVDFALKLEPEERLLFTGKKVGEEPVHAEIKITNPGKDRCSFKVKCTSNELFRIRTPLGILGGGESVTIALTFNGGKTIPDSGKHYFAIYYIKIGDEKKAARQFWQDHKGEPTGTKRLHVDFKKDNAGDANNNEKKAEDKEKKGDEKEKKGDEKKEEKKDEDKKEEGKKDDDKKDEKKEDDKKEDEKEDDKKDDDKKE